MGFKIGNPFKKIGKGISDAARKVTDSLGFTTPKIPASATPQLDPAKVAANAEVGSYYTDALKKYQGLEGATDQKYFNPRGYNPIKATEIQVQRPIVSGGAGAGDPPVYLQVPGQMKEGQRQVDLGPKEAGFSLDTSKYGGTVDEALDMARKAAVPQMVGYDPQRKALAMQNIERQLNQAQEDATRQAEERLAASGIAKSTIGAKAIGRIASDIAGKKADALTQLEQQDMEAAREDRFGNQQITASAANQVAQLGQVGQNVANQVAAFAREGRNIDARTAMQLAQFAREGGKIDDASAWMRYAQIRGESEQEAQEKRRVQGENLSEERGSQRSWIEAEDLGAQRGQRKVQDIVAGLQSYGSGSPYTPQSVAESERYWLQQDEKNRRLQNTLNMISKFGK